MVHTASEDWGHGAACVAEKYEHQIIIVLGDELSSSSNGRGQACYHYDLGQVDAKSTRSVEDGIRELKKVDIPGFTIVCSHLMSNWEKCFDANAKKNDNEVKWCFCGPVAVANCFWWFDSKYANPTGTPGDGQDEFRLVEDYTVGDDHSSANAPELICRLANAMKTCENGTTYVSNMQPAIEQWLKDTGLDDKFQVTTYNKPTFDFIESEIKRSQDVILSIGYYSNKKVDHNIGSMGVLYCGK